MGQCLPGQYLQGYYIQEKVDTGGYGEVRKAFKQGKQFAVKIIKKCLKNRQSIQRQKQLQQFSSPYIVKYYQNFQNEQNFYLVMELCNSALYEGFSKRGINLPENEQAKIRIQKDIIKGVAHIHKKGKCHSDLKLENILLQGSRAKIADFGLCMDLQTGILVSSPYGTQFYRSPDYYENNKRTKRSDCWALGLILYEIELGQRINKMKHLKGRFPYKIKDFPNQQHLSMIKCAKIKQIIKGLLQRSQKQRISAKQAKRMFIQISPSSSPISKKEVILVFVDYQHINAQIQQISQKKQVTKLTVKQLQQLKMNNETIQQINEFITNLSQFSELFQFQYKFNHPFERSVFDPLLNFLTNLKKLKKVKLVSQINTEDTNNYRQSWIKTLKGKGIDVSLN